MRVSNYLHNFNFCVNKPFKISVIQFKVFNTFGDLNLIIFKTF